MLSMNVIKNPDFCAHGLVVVHFCITSSIAGQLLGLRWNAGFLICATKSSSVRFDLFDSHQLSKKTPDFVI